MSYFNSKLKNSKAQKLKNLQYDFTQLSLLPDNHIYRLQMADLLGRNHDESIKQTGTNVAGWLRKILGADLFHRLTCSFCPGGIGLDGSPSIGTGSVLPDWITIYLQTKAAMDSRFRRLCRVYTLASYRLSLQPRSRIRFPGHPEIPLSPINHAICISSST